MERDVHQGRVAVGECLSEAAPPVAASRQGKPPALAAPRFLVRLPVANCLDLACKDALLLRHRGAVAEHLFAARRLAAG